MSSEKKTTVTCDVPGCEQKVCEIFGCEEDELLAVSLCEEHRQDYEILIQEKSDFQKKISQFISNVSESEKPQKSNRKREHTENNQHIDDKYCKNCGRKLEIKLEHKGFCDKCGSKRYKVYFVCPKFSWFWNVFQHHDCLTNTFLSNAYKKEYYCSQCDKEDIASLSE